MRSKITATRIGLRKPIAAAIAAVMLGQAPLADAAIFKELSKEALAEMRGKFVVGRHIQYFGMSVTTTWARTDAVADARNAVADTREHTSSAIAALSQQDAGHLDIGRQTDTAAAGAEGGHRVNMNLQVDNSGPETRVSYQVGGTLGEPVANTPAPAPNAALAQIDGAVQAIQVEGSKDPLSYFHRYSMLTDAQATPAPVDQTFQNGDMVTHFTTMGGVGFTITSQGNQVTQRLGMNPVTNHSQLLQAVQLEGDGHRVVNDLMLQVAFENALSQPDGLRFRADRVMNLL